LPQRQLLRLATAGSVDDGKSTLVGRLLHDCKAILADQIAHVQTVSEARGGDFDFALLTDGLRAEREQGITIDVAFRHFATVHRAFVLADTPGHQQYTRNMVTGASTADAVLVLVDARRGLSEQSRRHLAVAALLRVPQIVLAINKMDLVDYDEGRFEEICAEFTEFAGKLEIGKAPNLSAIDDPTASPGYKPVSLPSGSVVHMRYTYDNSARNVRNPSSPPVRVHAGNRSVDEMGHLWLQVLPRSDKNSAGVDPRMQLERVWMENRLRKNEKDDIALYNLASLTMMEGDGAQAVKLYRRVLERRPDDVRTITSLGTAMEASGDWQEAQAQYRAAMAKDPT